MTAPDKREEEAFAAADTFIKELKKAPEWLLHTDPGSARVLILRVRDNPRDPWTEITSPDPLALSAAHWQDFMTTVEDICEMRRMDRLHDLPETRTIRGS